MIAFPCSACQKSIQVQEPVAGKTVHCSVCGQVTVVPAEAVVTVAANDPQAPAQADTCTPPPPSNPDGNLALDRRDTDRASSLTDFLAPAQTEGELGRLGRYRILKVLGAGGMGVVFQAEDLKLQRVVALKLIHKDRLANPDAVKRFYREIQAAAALDHPNIVRAYDADQCGNVHFLTMEFVKGSDLSRLVKEHGPLPAFEACAYIRQATLGLQHAAERGLVHRDIKPHNLLLARSETGAAVIKILDMGLARLSRPEHGEDATSVLTREGLVMGTLDYMAPEQALDSHTVDIRADLYSLGCTFYFVLTGRVPFPGGEALDKLMKHRFDQPQPITASRPDVPAEVVAVVARLMAKEPQDRFQAPAELADALAAIAARPQGAIQAQMPAKPLRPRAADASPFNFQDTSSATPVQAPPPRRRHVLALVASAGGLALVLAAVMVLSWLASQDRKLQVVQGDKVIGAKAVPAVPSAALPAEQQMAAVKAELMRRNPEFDGELTYKIDSGAVTELQFLTDHVTDISPVQALTELRTLRCAGSTRGEGQIADLWPLKDMKLTELDCTDNRNMSNLWPLKDMKLTKLYCGNTKVSDLAPLKDMRLMVLHCDGTPVADLALLKDMPLSSLNCGYTKVSDLSPLKDMQLTSLYCRFTQVSDLSPLKDMPLRYLNLDFKPFRDAELVRSLETLERINGKPGAQFWQEVEAERVAFDAWISSVAALKPVEQVEAVKAKLIDCNPDFDGKMEHTLDKDGSVAELQFLTDNVTDISPVRALTELRKLKCYGSKRLDTQGKRGALSDLSPLRGMKLTELDCPFTRVADLSPLKDVKLTALACYMTPVSDLSPLKDMQLTLLSCNNTGISDLSSLKDMKLTYLACGATKVSDLSPLKDMKLWYLACSHTKVSDLSPLKDMRLTTLVFGFGNAQVTDLSPLKGMPLKHLSYPVKAERDAEILRSLKTLETINGKPAAEVLKDVEAKQAAFEAWLKVVAALPAEQQVAAVKAELMERNKGFDGKIEHKLDKGGSVAELKFLTDNVTDIWPVRALARLTKLQCAGSAAGKGVLADLSPLQNMPLRGLSCQNTRVADLAPLRDMTLTNLNCGGTKIADLAPLRDMKLMTLQCGGTQVSDLAPLKDMKLTNLRCDASKVSDLAPLKDMMLKELNCSVTQVSDLRPLKDMKLTHLYCHHTPVSDLAPLKGLPLTELDCADTPLSDLSPLQGMNLERVLFTPRHITKGLEVLRQMHSLKTIGTGWEAKDQLPAAAFWKALDNQETAFGAWLKEAAALPANEQVQAVKAELMKRNPGFDGTMTSKIGGGVVTGLTFRTDNVTDISPVRALARLRSFSCNGSKAKAGKLADLAPLQDIKLTLLRCHNNPLSNLSPLQNMKLTSLTCSNTNVSDLSPLKDMKLTSLSCHDTKVSDLSPLKDMKLTSLDCGGVRVSDLSPLQGMKLTYLSCNRSKVSDLSPLKGMPLITLKCDFRRERDAELLRSIKTLERINNKNAELFWKEMDAKKVEQAP